MIFKFLSNKLIQKINIIKLEKLSKFFKQLCKSYKYIY